MVFQRLFDRFRAPVELPSLEQGVRAYAVGDIHGRLDCLDALMAQIDGEPPFDGDTHLIFLGDYIDRGPYSRGVIDRLIAIRDQRPNSMFLMGNHEETLLTVLKGDRKAAALFDRIGGRETLQSYGVDSRAYDEFGLQEIIDAARTLVPAEHVAFLRAGIDRLALGSYRFVHAGLRPRIAFADQAGSDLRWIRREFLDHDRPFDGFVIHGHTVVEAIDERPNRINLDTGAYATGRLSAIGLEGDRQWFLQTRLD